MPSGVFELSASGTFAVKAPIGGRVTTILGRVGAHVDRDVLLVIILPRQFHLKAELYVPTGLSALSIQDRA